MGLLHAKPATYADIEALPPNVVGEILFGKLVVQPASALRHAAALSSVGFMLASCTGRREGNANRWTILLKPEIRLGPHIVVPDVAGWRGTPLRLDTEDQWIEVAPDWVCEVLAPETEASDRGPKRDVYCKHDVGYVWFVDPLKKSVEAHMRCDDSWQWAGCYQGWGDVSLPPFDSVEFSLGHLWPFDPKLTNNATEA